MPFFKKNPFKLLCCHLSNLKGCKDAPAVLILLIAYLIFQLFNPKGDEE